MLRRLPLEKVENFRDVGGYAARYGETSFGVLYRSASLSDATSGDLDKIAGLGIKTILDLRDPKAKETTPDRSANDPRFKTLLLDVNGNGRVPLNRNDQVASYLEMLEDPQSARAIFLAIAHAEKPLVIHCTAGKDRTGCFIAVLLLANGVPFHDVNADYMLSFPYLTRLKRVTMAQYPDFPKAVLTPSTGFLKRVFDKFNKRYGTVDEYFKTIGLGEDDIALLDNLLGKQEKSCGAVVFHEGKILVEHMAKGHYSIPKGHVEKVDASDEATALREIKEETNLDAKILSSETYHIEYSPKEGVAKKVVFFVASSEQTETKCQIEEVSGCYWLSPDDAIRTVSHDSDKKIIVWACALMQKLKR
jgi:protein tyrosine/serine phosphatase/8-oxo-dGTP pyrophosphatase MutT (NUDIX family)